MENSGELINPQKTKDKTPEYSSIGGIKYLDNNYSYDIFDRYNVDVNSYNSLWQVSQKIQERSIKVDPETLNDRQKLIFNVTKISPAENPGLLSEYIAVKQALIIEKYNMPDPSKYIGKDENKFIEALKNNADKKGVEILDTHEKLEKFDKNNNFDSVQFFKNNPEAEGFFNPNLKNKIFIKPNIDHPSAMISHEMIHQAQNQEVLKHHDPHFIFTSEEKEFEAYVYEIIGSEYLAGDMSKADTKDYMKSVVGKLVHNMNVSVKYSYGDKQPKYLQK
jgi:hypothetical protein